jgi:putative Mg2+ transporter-C (MgtC) family protein
VSVVAATSPSNVEVIVRLAVATGLGAGIGLEREIDGKDAGMRTHALLALGAAVFGVLSVGAFGDFIAQRDTTNVQVDVTRVASYVAAGVGFLAGGAIVKQSDRVRGLTTATSLWSVAALGLAAGHGLWIVAIVGSVITLLMLLLEKPLVALRLHRRQRSVSVVLRPGADASAVLDLLVPAVGDEAHVSFVKGEGGASTLHVRGLRPKQARALLLQLQAREDVIDGSIP